MKRVLISFVFALTASVSMLAQENTGARKVSYHSQDIVPIRAKMKYSTLIEVPPSEKIRTDGDQSTLSLAERYANRITELVRAEPGQSIEKVLESLQPSAIQAIHWEPAMNAIGAAQTDTLLWMREHGDIQSYQQSVEPRGWLHIDSAGEFFDRSAKMISPEQATIPLGISIPDSIGNMQSKDPSNNTGFGVSL